MLTEHLPREALRPALLRCHNGQQALCLHLADKEMGLEQLRLLPKVTHPGMLSAHPGMSSSSIPIFQLASFYHTRGFQPPPFGNIR